MNNYLNSLLAQLIKASSEEEMKAILERAIQLITSGVLTEEEAITFTTQIINIKKRLGLIESKNYDLFELRNIIKKIPRERPDNNRWFEIDSLYALLSEDNLYTLASLNWSHISDIHGGILCKDTKYFE